MADGLPLVLLCCVCLALWFLYQPATAQSTHTPTSTQSGEKNPWDTWSQRQAGAAGWDRDPEEMMMMYPVNGDEVYRSLVSEDGERIERCVPIRRQHATPEWCLCHRDGQCEQLVDPMIDPMMNYMSVNSKERMEACDYWKALRSCNHTTHSPRYSTRWPLAERFGKRTCEKTRGCTQGPLTVWLDGAPFEVYLCDGDTWLRRYPMCRWSSHGESPMNHRAWAEHWGQEAAQQKDHGPTASTGGKDGN